MIERKTSVLALGAMLDVGDGEHATLVVLAAACAGTRDAELRDAVVTVELPGEEFDTNGSGVGTEGRMVGTSRRSMTR